MRPFGTDDDDIELSYILDRHVQASFTLVNSVCQQSPALVPDKFWRDSNNLDAAIYSLPHTKNSAKIKEHPPKLHAYAKLKHPTDAELVDTVRVDLMNRVNANGIEPLLPPKESKTRWRQF